MSMMTFTAPGFNHILYKKLSAEGNPAIPTSYVPVYSRSVGMAATDGTSVIFNPDNYFEWKLPWRVFVLAHEIVHNMLGDVERLHSWVAMNCVIMPDGRRLAFDMDCAQRAMDARINALLIESKIGERPDDGWFDDKVKGSDSVYPIYERYLQNKQQGQKPGDQPGNRPGNTPQQGGKPQPKQSFDEILQPGAASAKNPHEAAEERSEDQWQVETKVAEHLELERTKSIDHPHGKLPASMQMVFKQLLEPEVSWLDYVETLIKRHMGDGSIDWTQPHAWFGDTDSGDQYFVPSEAGTGAGWIVIWDDTSGSVFHDSVQARNIGEMAGVIDQVRPSRLTVIFCDASIKDGGVVELDEGSDLRNLKPVGGGGTSYKPVLDWIAKNNRGEQPDLFIAFTDGYVTFAEKAHPFPTIWASSTKPGEAEYPPYGQVVYINNIARS